MAMTTAKQRLEHLAKTLAECRNGLHVRATRCPLALIGHFKSHSALRTITNAEIFDSFNPQHGFVAEQHCRLL